MRLCVRAVTMRARRKRWPRQALLPRLTGTEQLLYQALCTNRYGDNLRLEQERIVLSCLGSALAKR
jgi:hypothetical protein